jgi:hypothetical protein
MTSSKYGQPIMGVYACPGMNGSELALSPLDILNCIAPSEPAHESIRASGDSRGAVGCGLRGAAGFETDPDRHCRRRFPPQLPGLLFINTIVYEDNSFGTFELVTFVK